MTNLFLLLSVHVIADFYFQFNFKAKNKDDGESEDTKDKKKKENYYAALNYVLNHIIKYPLLFIGCFLLLGSDLRFVILIELVHLLIDFFAWVIANKTIKKDVYIFCGDQFIHGLMFYVIYNTVEFQRNYFSDFIVVAFAILVLFKPASIFINKINDMIFPKKKSIETKDTINKNTLKTNDTIAQEEYVSISVCFNALFKKDWRNVAQIESNKNSQSSNNNDQKPINNDSDETSRDFEIKTGRYIGYLERAIVFLICIFGSVEGIGFVLAAKTLVRYKEINSDDNQFQEKYLIGTLLSTIIALCCYALVVIFCEPKVCSLLKNMVK